MTNGLQSLPAWYDDFKRIFQYDKNDTTIIVEGGLTSGSCGAQFMTNQPKVIAIHLESLNETEEIKVTGHKRVMGVAESLSDFSDCIHMSVKIALGFSPPLKLHSFDWY
jgi:hypothetical protein